MGVVVNFDWIVSVIQSFLTGDEPVPVTFHAGWRSYGDVNDSTYVMMGYLPNELEVQVYPDSILQFIVREKDGHIPDVNKFARKLFDLLVHEMRHALQHRWLIEHCASREEADRLFMVFTNTPDYMSAPLEIDARLTQKGKGGDIDEFMWRLVITNVAA